MNQPTRIYFERDLDLTKDGGFRDAIEAFNLIRLGVADIYSKVDAIDNNPEFVDISVKEKIVEWRARARAYNKLIEDAHYLLKLEEYLLLEHSDAIILCNIKDNVNERVRQINIKSKLILNLFE